MVAIPWCDEHQNTGENGGARLLKDAHDTPARFRLPAFETRMRVRERKHPKLYWIDPGLVRAVKKHHGPVTAEERGALLEGWVVTLLRAYAEETELYDEIRSCLNCKV